MKISQNTIVAEVYFYTYDLADFSPMVIKLAFCGVGQESCYVGMRTHVCVCVLSIAFYLHFFLVILSCQCRFCYCKSLHICNVWHFYGYLPFFLVYSFDILHSDACFIIVGVILCAVEDKLI